MKFLVTGANGFVGRALCAELLRQGHSVRGAVRNQAAPPSDVEVVTTGAIDGVTDWAEALRDVEVVIHLAARVHVMRETADNPRLAFVGVNVHGTENLARQAVRAGVRRLVYVSSVKVNGEQTTATQSFSETDQAAPQDPYGVSKWQAEQLLQGIAQACGLEVVIVRPPLVYGAGVKGNFIRLLRAIDRGIPLPLASARNARSLIYVGNLASALIACATHPAAAGQTYLVRDNEDVSTAQLVGKIASVSGRSDRSFCFPGALLRAVALLLGRAGQVDRLFGSLRVSDAKIRRELGWTPPYSLEQGLQATVDWYGSRGTGYNRKSS